MIEDDIPDGKDGRGGPSQTPNSDSRTPKVDDGGNGCGERFAGRGRQPQPPPNSQGPEGPFGRPGGGRKGRK